MVPPRSKTQAMRRSKALECRDRLYKTRKKPPFHARRDSAPPSLQTRFQEAGNKFAVLAQRFLAGKKAAIFFFFCLARPQVVRARHGGGGPMIGR